jgi:proteic killer suppression protein
VKLILSAMDVADRPQMLDLPGLGFHALRGNRKGEYAVSVSGNWRLTFGWSGDDAINVGLEDYHGR